MNYLEQLRTITTVVADTGEIEAIAHHKPIDATTNPSLLLKAAQMPKYQEHVESAIAYGKERASDEQQQQRKAQRPPPPAILWFPCRGRAVAAMPG